MKLLLLSSDTALYGKLRNTPALGQISISTDVECLGSENQRYDAIILSDRCISFDRLPYIRENFKDSILFFMISSGYEYKLFQRVETMCHAHDVNIIYPKQTQEQILSFISGVVCPCEQAVRKHVAAFVGAQPKVGVTSTVMSVATRLGMNTDASIGLLVLNSVNPGTVYIKEYKGNYLDELKTLLANNMLSSAQLMKEMYRHNHFYCLAGNRDIKKRLHYSIREIHYLIEQAKKVYDLVLIDAGSSFDDALCIQGLINADTKFLITNQQLSSYLAWTSAFEQVLQPTGFSLNDFLMIINRYRQTPQLPDIKQLARDYRIPCIRHIADVGELGMIVEVNRNLIIDYDEPEYCNDIDFIVKALIKTYRLNEKVHTGIKRPGLIKRLFG